MDYINYYLGFLLHIITCIADSFLRSCSLNHEKIHCITCSTNQCIECNCCMHLFNITFHGTTTDHILCLVECVLYSITIHTWPDSLAHL